MLENELAIIKIWGIKKNNMFFLKGLLQSLCDVFKVEFPVNRFFPEESTYRLVVPFALRFFDPLTGPLSSIPRAALLVTIMVGFIDGEA